MLDCCDDGTWLVCVGQRLAAFVDVGFNAVARSEMCWSMRPLAGSEDEAVSELVVLLLLLLVAVVEGAVIQGQRRECAALAGLERC